MGISTWVDISDYLKPGLGDQQLYFCQRPGSLLTAGQAGHWRLLLLDVLAVYFLSARRFRMPLTPFGSASSSDACPPRLPVTCLAMFHGCHLAPAQAIAVTKR
jgi:hypothetical protein